MQSCPLPNAPKKFYVSFFISIREEYLGSTEVQGSCRVATVLLVSCCPSSPFIAVKGAIAEMCDRMESYFARLLLHLVIRVDEVVVLILIVVLPKLLISFGEVDGPSACARALNDVGCLDLFHVILIGLLGCSR